ncbi:MAG: hypothetical protein BWK80_44810 [Desulfobacteraceae bacterium IS3]|nr:MAG: hypothetical protein BWK80_44810 [Desulfobacteraceae bacterium IS3]
MQAVLSAKRFASILVFGFLLKIRKAQIMTVERIQKKAIPHLYIDAPVNEYSAGPRPRLNFVFRHELK